MSDSDAPTIPLAFERLDADAMKRRSEAFLARVKRRRSVRAFSDEPIPLDVVRDCIAAAASAPSGANKQPWTFVLVTDPAVKRQIREGAEQEERAFYGGRAGDRWLKDLEPFGTDASKPYLESVPALVVVFAQKRSPEEDQH